MIDLQQIQQKYPEAAVKINSGTPTTVFIMTSDMVALQKLYGQVIMVSVSKKRKNKYDFYTILLSSINNYGNPVVIGLGFTNIKCKEAYAWLLQCYVNRVRERNGDPQPELMVVPLESEAIDSIDVVFKQKRVMRIVNQYSFLSVTRDLIQPYKKRMNFDHLLAQQKLDQIVQCRRPDIFERLKADLMIMTGSLDHSTRREFDKIFKLASFWGMPSYQNLYTAGLHSNERLATMETFIRVQHKYESSVIEIIESLKTL